MGFLAWFLSGAETLRLSRMSGKENDATVTHL
jgi:hypothetical protein